MTHRYRSMDTLRSIAIIAVFTAHTILSYGAPSYIAPLQLGGTGVDLFFVLSGWLLGCQLYKEANNSGGVDVLRFWSRRWFRTLPAYYAVLIFSVAQRYLTKDDVTFPTEYFFFVQNYYYPLDFFSVSWSLCVEEQFYLLVGPFIAFTARINPRVSLILLCITLFMPSVFRLLGLYEHPTETHVRFDGCIMGVLLACLYQQHRYTWDLMKKQAATAAICALIAYIFYYIIRYFPETGISDPSKLLLSFIFGAWVVYANSNDSAREKLYFPGAHYIATRSYSIYLLHPEALAIIKYIREDVPFLVYFALAALISILVSEILYRTIELTFLRVRDKVCP